MCSNFRMCWYNSEVIQTSWSRYSNTGPTHDPTTSMYHRWDRIFAGMQCFPFSKHNASHFKQKLKMSTSFFFKNGDFLLFHRNSIYNVVCSNYELFKVKDKTWQANKSYRLFMCLKHFYFIGQYTIQAFTVWLDS